MTLTVGRVTLPERVHVTGYSGNNVTIEGSIVAAEATYATYVAQLQGLYEAAQPPYADEPIVPVTWSQDSSLDGFYYVNNVSAHIGTLGDRGNYVPWTLDLERVAGNPAIESSLTGALRTNDHTITTATVKGWHAVPAESLSYSYNAVAGATTARSADGGRTLNMFVPTTSLMSAWVESFVAPTNYYWGAAQVNAGVALGRRALPTSIDNGLVRLSSIAQEFVTLSAYDGSAWETVAVFALSDGGAGAVSIKPTTGRILRNRPEDVRIRFDVAVLGAGATTGTIDFTLRRGERTVRCYLATRANVTLWVVDSAAAAASSLTGGRRATSNDASGNRYLIATPTTFTNQTGGLSFAAGTSRHFGLGAEVGGTAATGENTGQQMIYQYMAAQSERQMVVQR